MIECSDSNCTPIHLLAMFSFHVKVDIACNKILLYFLSSSDYLFNSASYSISSSSTITDSDFRHFGFANWLNLLQFCMISLGKFTDYGGKSFSFIKLFFQNGSTVVLISPKAKLFAQIFNYIYAFDNSVTIFPSVHSSNKLFTDIVSSFQYTIFHSSLSLLTRNTFLTISFLWFNLCF